MTQGRLKTWFIHPLSVTTFISLATLIISLFVLFVVFQLLLPELGDPRGFMDGHDARGFNVKAIELAELINQQGWSAWQLEYGNQPVIGILGAVYAAFTPSPAVWAVFQSISYGIGGGLLVATLVDVFPQSVLPFMATIVAIFLPTAAMIYMLPHNDIFVFLGYMLFVFGWWKIASASKSEKALSYDFIELAVAFTAVVFGIYIAQVFRDFTTDMFAVTGVVMWLVVLALGLGCRLRSVLPWRKTLLPILVGALAAAVPFHAFERATFTLAEDDGVRQHSAPITIISAADAMLPVVPIEATDQSASQHNWEWQETAWLPGFLDAKLMQLSRARQRVIVLEGHARSALDVEVNFYSATDVIAYIPRAVHLAMLSPLPNQWWPHPEASFSRNFQRVVAGAEMLVVYPALVGLGFAMWIWRRRLALWCLVIPASAWIIVYGLAVPVAGSLIRFRYPAYVSLIAIGFLGLFYLASRWRQQRSDWV